MYIFVHEKKIKLSQKSKKKTHVKFITGCDSDGIQTRIGLPSLYDRNATFKPHFYNLILKTLHLDNQSVNCSI